MSQINDKKRRDAVARILSGETTAADEAQRLGKDKRTVERWVATTKEVSQNAATNVVSQNAAPPGEMPQNVALEAAKKAAFPERQPETTKSVSPPSPVETAIAAEDAIKFCVTTVGQLKQAVGGAVVTFKYSPPLQLVDPKVQELLAVGPLAEAAIRANWQQLYGTLGKLMNGPWQLAGALALDAVFMFVGLNSYALQKGWKAEPKKDDGPSMADQIDRARPRPPAASPQLAAALQPTAPPPKEGTILDAPLPDPEAAAA